MGHSPELLRQIADHVRQTYPDPEYRLQFEGQFMVTGSAGRAQPDIRVTDSYGRVVCCVEIGYTRPEKLRAYREAGIADVRWYSKSGDLELSETPRAMQPVVRQVKYEVHEDDRWQCYHSASGVAEVVFEFDNHGDSWCDKLLAALERMSHEVSTIRKNGGGTVAQVRHIMRVFRFDANHPDRDVFLDHDMWYDREFIQHILSEQEIPDELVIQHGDCCVTYWTNGHYLFAVNYCDCCREHAINYTPWEFGFNYPETYRDFLDHRMTQITRNLDLENRKKSAADAVRGMRCMVTHTPEEMVSCLAHLGLNVNWANLRQAPMWKYGRDIAAA